MFIQKENCTGGFSQKYIQQRFCRPNERVLYTRFGNIHMAIIVNDSYIGDDLPAPIITMDVQEEIPLWKQSMQLQMGQMPKSHRSNRVTRHIRWLNEDEIHGNMRFEVYRCISL